MIFWHGKLIASPGTTHTDYNRSMIKSRKTKSSADPMQGTPPKKIADVSKVRVYIEGGTRKIIVFL